VDEEVVVVNPDILVDHHLIPDIKEEEVEEDEGNDAVLVDDEEEKWQHLINYAVSLPVVARALAGCCE
jgi:hypothetical protein